MTTRLACIRSQMKFNFLASKQNKHCGGLHQLRTFAATTGLHWLFWKLCNACYWRGLLVGCDGWLVGWLAVWLAGCFSAVANVNAIIRIIMHLYSCIGNLNRTNSQQYTSNSIEIALPIYVQSQMRTQVFGILFFSMLAEEFS